MKDVKIYHAVYVLKAQKKLTVMPEDKIYGKVELGDSAELSKCMNYWKLSVTLEEYQKFKEREGKRVWFEIIDIQKDKDGKTTEAFARFIKDYEIAE